MMKEIFVMTRLKKQNLKGSGEFEVNPVEVVGIW